MYAFTSFLKNFQWDRLHLWTQTVFSTAIDFFFCEQYACLHRAFNHQNWRDIRGTPVCYRFDSLSLCTQKQTCLWTWCNRDGSGQWFILCTLIMVHSPSVPRQIWAGLLTPVTWAACWQSETDRLSKKVLHVVYWSWTWTKIYIIWINFWLVLLGWCYVENLSLRKNPDFFFFFLFQKLTAMLVSAKWCLSVFSVLHLCVLFCDVIVFLS